MFLKLVWKVWNLLVNERICNVDPSARESSRYFNKIICSCYEETRELVCQEI